MQTENQSMKPETELKQETGEGCPEATCSASDPYEREAAKAAIHTLQRELARCKEECVNLREERDEAIRMREWDNRAISIARHYGHEDSRRREHKFEDYRIRPALVLEKSVAVAIDGWVGGNSVTIQLCREEVEQWVALVCVHGQDVTAFSADEIGLCEDVQEVWMTSAVLAALDHARSMPVESESQPNVERLHPYQRGRVSIAGLRL
jgi:hypothetical protein